MYPTHNTLVERFREADAKVEGGEVVGLPDLETQHGTYHVASVREVTDLEGNTCWQVKLGHKERSWLAFSLDFDGEWSLSLELCDKLNKLKVVPDCNGGRVALERYEDESYRETRSLTPEELEWLELSPDSDGCFGSVEAHPEGSDRGGYVPTLDAGPHYDEGGGEWQG